MAISTPKSLPSNSAPSVNPADSAPPPYQPNAQPTPDTLRDTFLHWQYAGRKNRKAESAVALALLPTVAAYGTGLVLIYGVLHAMRSRKKPEALRKHCFNLTDVVRTPKESEALISQLKEHGVLRKHSRQREIIGLQHLDEVLPQLRLNGKPLPQTQQDAVRSVLLIHHGEVQRRAAEHANVADLEKRLKDKERDSKQRYGARSAESLARDHEYKRLLDALQVAQLSLTVPGGLVSSDNLLT